MWNVSLREEDRGYEPNWGAAYDRDGEHIEMEKWFKTVTAKQLVLAA